MDATSGMLVVQRLHPFTSVRFALRRVRSSADGGPPGPASGRQDTGRFRASGRTSGTMTPVRSIRGETSMAYLEGRLQGDVVGTGGEHTGYVLEVEVDMSAVQNAGEIVGEQVAVTGEVEIVDYPERGKVLIFKATSAAAIEEEVEEEIEEVE